MSKWPLKPLGEVCDVRIGRTPRRDDPRFCGGNAVWVTVRELNGGKITSSNETVSDNAVRECMPELVPAGTLLFSFKLSIGKMAVAGCPLYTNEAIAALPIKNPAELARDFLRYALLRCSHEGTADTAVMGKVLNRRKVQSLPIPLPPLAEQERIVKLLDEADGLRKLRAQADRRTAELIPALFHEMFGEVKFAVSPIGDVTSLVTSGATPRGGEGVYTREGPYFIRSQNVQMNRLDLAGAACLPSGVHHQMARTQVATGDVLLNITGASIGRVAWVGELDRAANVSQHVCLIRPKPDSVDSIYLSVLISLPTTQNFILRNQAGASRQALNHKQVRAIEIPLPPLPLQNIFARRVSEIRQMETAQAASRARLDALFQSMLHRAFNGEL